MKLSSLLGKLVVTESGRKLGHLAELRAVRDPSESEESDVWRIEALLVGTRGGLLRVGQTRAKAAIRSGRHQEVPWESVVTLGYKQITVRDLD